VLSSLDSTLVNKDAREYLLGPPINSLNDIETYLLPQALDSINADYLVPACRPPVTVGGAPPEIR